MIDTTGLNTAAAAGLELEYAFPFNGSSPATFMLVTRLRSGGPDRDSFFLGQRNKVFTLANDSAFFVHIDFVKYDGTHPKLRTYLQYRSGVAVGIEYESDDLGLGAANWAGLEDKWLVIAMQYRGGTTPHKQFTGIFHEGSGWDTYEATAGGNVNTLTLATPTNYGFGWTNGNTNERQPYSDGNLYYQFHGETWDLDTFDAVCESLIAADGTKKSIAGPVNLIAEQRTGAAACHFVGPVRRPKAASFTTQKYFGESIANADSVGAVVKTTGFVDTSAVAWGTGSCSLEDPADYGFVEDPEAVTPDIRVRGQQGRALREITGAAAYTAQRTLVTWERSRNANNRGFWLSSKAGLAVNLGVGESLDTTQFPNGEMIVGSGFDSGFNYELWDDVVGTFSFMPQWSYAVNTSNRGANPMVDVAGTGGSYKTAAVLGSFEVANSIDQGAQRFGGWSNTAPGGSVVGRYAFRLAPGQSMDFWFFRPPGMTPGDPWIGSVMVLGLPGGPDVELQAMSHGEVTSNTAYPIGASGMDWIGDAASRTTSTTTRGTNDNPTVDVDGTDITVPPADTTGDQPEVGDVVLLKGDNLSGRMGLSVFDTGPDGSGDATTEHPFDTNNNGASLVTNPTLTWGPYDYSVLEGGVQEGEPDAHGPMMGVRLTNPSGSTQDVFAFGAGVRANDDVHGVKVVGLGHGGNNYTVMHSSSFTTEDADGLNSNAKLCRALDIDAAIIYPTYGASVDEVDDIYASILAGCPNCEIYGGMGVRWPNDTFVTGSSTDGYRDEIYDNAQNGAVDVSGAYSGVHAVLNGLVIDDEHYSADAVIRSAELMLSNLSTLDLAPTATGVAFALQSAYARRRSGYNTK